jgi:NitT/TauT family transport system substrate-binding protein
MTHARPWHRRTFLAAAAGASLAPAQLARAAGSSLVFMTDWKAQAEHGGFYQALASGLYARAGLNVALRAGGPQSDNTRLLAAGAIDLAMISNSFQAMTLAARGADVKIVMASFQKDPQILMAHAGTGITSIASMKGRPVYIGDASIPSYWRYLRARFGFEDKQIRKYGFSLAPWLRDRQAIQQGYLSSEPYMAAQAGAKPQVFLLADGDFPGYAGMVGATGKYLALRPDLVRAFIAASSQGWLDYLTGDPGAANRLIKRDNPEMTDGLLAFARKQMLDRNMVLVTGGKPGMMTAARWDAFRKLGIEVGLYPKSLKAISAYRLDFLPK